MNRLGDRSPSEYNVTLSDGKRYCFYPTKTYNPKDGTTSTARFKVKTIESIQDEDWKTAIAQNKKEIPANTELEVLDVLTNCYGRWLEVIYNHSLYNIDPSKVEYVDNTKTIYKMTDLEALDCIVVDLTPIAKIHNREEIEQIKKSLKVLEIIKDRGFLFIEKGELYCGEYGDTELLLDEDDFETKEDFTLVKEFFENDRN